MNIEHCEGCAAFEDGYCLSMWLQQETMVTELEVCPDPIIKMLDAAEEVLDDIIEGVPAEPSGQS